MIKNNKENRIWHLWLINLIALLFYSIGAYDFFNIAIQNMEYLTRQYNPLGVEYFTNYPIPLLCLFGFNILTGVLGIVTAFFNTKWASRLILISGIANFILILITVVFMDRINNIGFGLTLQDTFIMLATFGLFLYYRWLNEHSLKY